MRGFPSQSNLFCPDKDVTRLRTKADNLIKTPTLLIV
jgi:hypothetical protein